ncbi:MAG: hypothetical protein COS24_00350 [Candidatus Nealsonbacteria bacterium CG02_land_8_20_14_3_00_34_20]|uniref:Dephospho-coenzyme A kinase n=2 Tax=Candidatus Nealsoniibacteriota TaxID=1817911 RepID=A0A2M7DBJ7_9BACT|nr:MAG: hypothetical protein COV62_01445 [Candidatus Nealsonbacteria bacterium CG11_big_fil_rev_8_21_14_0_20_35_11]PIV45777.1 MAG: hypothetical protein COS24_00350 [Candidatus Nealsonbacteria bacterium CG02_land_8_20_14_3_00_34_20]PIW92772.1 MAG: hypothetical protein COZ88_00405 [Candidatus Nealsonbacteria bacterium CG_4_8_14_3_um_filter_34_13]
MIRTYYLPNELRKELKKIWGIHFFGSKTEVGKKIKEFCRKKKFKKIITVGDYCSFYIPSDIKIFDGKIKRKKVKKLPKFSLKCDNPPRTIRKETWPILKKAIKNNKNVFVEGEEDLLVIPSVLLARKNTAVIYGFPDKGVCLIEVSSKMKKVLKKLLKKFKTN